MTNKLLSKEAEAKVIDGLKRAVGMVDAGTDVNSSMAKIATDLGWGPDMIKFACHAYNTGRQNAQLGEGKTALEKFADFPLADPHQIISSIWPAAVKVAVEQLWPVSAEYSRRPVFKKSAETETVKVAAAMCETCGKSPCCCPVKKSYEQLSREHTRLKRAAESARHEAAAAYNALLVDMGRLGSYFRKAAMDRFAFSTVKQAAEAWHGNAGLQLMESVYQRERLKEARADDNAVLTTPLDRRAEPFTLIDRCIKQAGKVAACRAAEDAAVTAADTYASNELVPRVSPATKTASFDLIGGTQIKTTYAEDAYKPYLIRKKAAAVPPPPEEPWSLLQGVKVAEGMFGTFISPAIQAATKNTLENFGSGSDPVDKATLELDDPAHDAELRSIRTQALLSDLMNDPVIGGYDPNEVAGAYNELSQLSPRSAQQPALMRAALRRHLQGNVQPFETGEALNTEKSLKDTGVSGPQAPQFNAKPKSK